MTEEEFFIEYITDSDTLLERKEPQELAPVPVQQFDVGVVLHQHEGAPVAQGEVEGGEGLATLDVVEAAAGVGDVQVLGQRHVVLQHQPNPVRVHPLLP